MAVISLVLEIKRGSIPMRRPILSMKGSGSMNNLMARGRNRIIRESMKGSISREKNMGWENLFGTMGPLTRAISNMAHSTGRAPTLTNKDGMRTPATTSRTSSTGRASRTRSDKTTKDSSLKGSAVVRGS
jgi:hypothetical protein